MDSEACNYNWDATEDDCSCQYAQDDGGECGGNNSCYSNWDLNGDGAVDVADFVIGILGVINQDLTEFQILACDSNNDEICDELDNCPEIYNPNQEDFNLYGIGDACDGIGLDEETIGRNLIKVIGLLGR